MEYSIKRQQSELYHHGIFGQRWGIRRYQNEDGTRTDAGKKREAAARRETDSMSDEELRAKVNRLNDEQNYRRIMGNRNKSKTSQNLRTAANVMQIGASTLEIGNAVTGGKYKDAKTVVNDAKRVTDSTSRLSDQIDKNRENPEVSINLKKMSDAELKKNINRLLLEEQYDRLMAPKRVTKGEKFTNKILPTIASVVGVAGSLASLALTIQSLRK